MTPSSPGERSEFQLRFRPLSAPGRTYGFPCDASGRVNMDGLDDRIRDRYLYARALVGLELSTPVVQRCAAEPGSPSSGERF